MPVYLALLALLQPSREACLLGPGLLLPTPSLGTCGLRRAQSLASPVVTLLLVTLLNGQGLAGLMLAAFRALLVLLVRLAPYRQLPAPRWVG